MTGDEIIYIVDDETGMLVALSRLLRAEGFSVACFSSALDFLNCPAGDQPACLVLDVAMPGIDGLELQRRLAGLGNAIPIIFLTGHGDIPMSVRAIKNGAVDFLTKPVNDADLLRAIQTALEMSRLRLAEKVKVNDERLRYSNLTPREREVFRHVIAGKLNKHIAAELGIVEQTIKIHRMRMMDKMGIKSVADLVLLAQRLGIPRQE